MKKKPILILTLTIVIKLAAAQVPFGLKAGLVMPYYTVKSDNVSLNASIKVGFTAGIVSSFRINKAISFQPGLNFIRKGGN